MGSIIEKVRFLVPHQGLVWEIDVFAGQLAGLVWAEVELESETQAFVADDWLGREITDDPRYRHASLLALCAGKTEGWNLADLVHDMSRNDRPRSIAAPGRAP